MTAGCKDKSTFPIITATKLIECLLSDFSQLYSIIEENKDVLYESDITRAFKSRQSVMRAVRRPWCKSYNWSSILSQGHSGQSDHSSVESHDEPEEVNVANNRNRSDNPLNSKGKPDYDQEKTKSIQDDQRAVSSSISFFWEPEKDDGSCPGMSDFLSVSKSKTDSGLSYSSQLENDETDDDASELISHIRNQCKTNNHPQESLPSSNLLELKNKTEDFIYDIPVERDVKYSDISDDKMIEDIMTRDNSDLICLSDPCDHSFDMPMPPWGYPEPNYISMNEIARKSNIYNLHSVCGSVTRKTKPAISKRVLNKVGFNVTGGLSVKKTTTTTTNTPTILPSLMPRCLSQYNVGKALEQK